MVDYVKLAATADRLVGGAGRSVTLIAKGAQVDALKPWDGAADGSTEGTTGVFTNYTRREIDGTKIQANDKRLFIAAASLTLDPQNAYKVLDGSVEYQVINVRVVQPGAVTIGYELQVRS